MNIKQSPNLHNAAEVGSRGGAQHPHRQFLFLDAKRLILLITLGALTVGLLLTLGDGRAAVAVLVQVDWRLIALAVAVHYSGFAVRGWRWRLLLAALGHRRSWRSLTALLISGWFISALLPARAGDVARVGLLSTPAGSEPAVPVADGLSSLVLERVLDMTTILTLGAGFGFAALRTQAPTWVMAGYAIGVAGLAVFAATLFVAPLVLMHLRRWSSQRLWLAFLDFISHLVKSLQALAQQPQQACWTVLASLYIWLCDALLLWLVVWSLGAFLPFAQAGFVALTVDVFAAAPLTPGGVGQIEAANAALLALVGQPVALSAAAVLANRAISYWSFLLFSGVVTFSAGIWQLLRREAPTTPEDLPK